MERGGGSAYEGYVVPAWINLQTCVISSREYTYSNIERGRARTSGHLWMPLDPPLLETKTCWCHYKHDVLNH